jgi:hypothetical protein
MEYWSNFINNNYSIPDSLRVSYQRSGVLWNNKKLNKLAINYDRSNAVAKAKPNMTAILLSLGE